MSTPFSAIQKHSKDFRSHPIGPAWFQRNVAQWELRVDLPILLGGKDGGTLKESILHIIKNSKEILAICSFLLSDKELVEAIIDASKRGVRCYILTASKDRISKDTSETDAWRKQVQAEHEEMLDALCSRTLLRDAQVHAKFILSDPHRESRHGILSTANFTTDAFLHPEIGLDLDKVQIEELFKIFKCAWWGLGERELLQPKRLTNKRDISPPVDDNISNTINALQRYLVTFPDHSMALQEEIVRLCKEVQGALYVATYGISDDNRIFSELGSLAQNKEIRLLVRQRPKTTPYLHQLRHNGVHVRGLDDLHAKVICGRTESGVEALIMTANLERISLEEGFEVGILLRGNGANQILDIMNHWWKNATWEYEISRSRGDHLGIYLTVNGGDFKKQEIINSKTIPLGPQPIDNLANLGSFRPSFPEVINVQNVEYTWSVQPRELPDNCKPHTIEGLDSTIKVWKCGKKKRILISVSSEKDLERVLGVPNRPGVPIVYARE